MEQAFNLPNAGEPGGGCDSWLAEVPVVPDDARRRHVSDPPPGAVSDEERYPIMLNFSNFKDVAQRNFFLNLPTSFFLPATDVDRLREAGRGLLQDNPVFQDLLRDLARERAAAIDEGG